MATQYASTTDLANLGLPATTLALVSSTIQNAELLAASEVTDSYLRKRYTLPLIAYGSDIVRAVVAIASFKLLCRIGFNPTNGADPVVAKGHDDAILWLRDVAKGIVEPSVSDSTATTIEDSPVVLSDDSVWPAIGGSSDGC